MMSGADSVRRRLKEATFRRPPTPDVEGEQNYGFALARAFMPLSAPISVGENASATELDEDEPSLRRAL
jgi:hypothetical protein